MAYNFRKDEKNWVEYRHLPKLTELDFHDWYKDPYQQYRVFPEGKDMFPHKGQVIGVFLAVKPPLAVLLNGKSCRNKAIAA
jgi:hypothetical protein